METRTNANGSLDSFRRHLENVEGREEMLSIVQKLIDERDELARRQEHLHSLARLFEKTVSNADDLAGQIKKEAAESAESQAREILAQAEERSQHLLEEIKSQALLETQDEVSTIRASAEREIQAAFRQQAAVFQGQVKETAERLYREMLAQAEECSSRLSVFEAELEKNLSGLHIPAVRTEDTESIRDEPRTAVREAPAKQPSSQAAAPAASPAKGKAASQEKLVEIEILPPRDKAAIDTISAYLNRLDEVAAADVVHMTDRTMIRVLLLQPIDVAARLSGLSEVESARDVADGEHSKVEIVLSVHAAMEKEREALNLRAHRLAARIARNEELRGSPAR